MSHRYALLGAFIGDSGSPEIYTHFSSECHLEWSYELLDVTWDACDLAVADFLARGGRGLNVTAPFKGWAFQQAIAHTPEALKAQSVNVLRWDDDQGGWLGHSTDGPGWHDDVRAQLACPLEGASVLLVGAGYAIQSLLPCVTEANARDVCVAHRDVGKARSMLVRLGLSSSVRVAPDLLALSTSWDIIVLGISASLQGQSVDWSWLPAKGAHVYDLNYGEHAKASLQAARDLGAQTVHDGLGMLVYQAGRAFAWWTGRVPSIQSHCQIMAALRAQGAASVSQRSGV